MSIKVSDFVASFIASLGVKDVFLIVGGSCVNLVDSVAKNNKLTYICNHHEQASAMAAECYARITGNIGVCIVTVGPGATNTITGIAGAWLDSIPTLFISGQVKREDMIVNCGSDVRQLGVQELNAIDLIKPITKYAAVVMDPMDIKYQLQKAVFLAKTGRPGPVYLDIPSDVQGALIREKDLTSFDPNKEKQINGSDDLSHSVAKVIDLLKNSKRPILFIGHGIRLSSGQDEILQLVNKLHIPVLTSMSAHDLIPSDHEMYIGRPGVFGDRAGNFVIQNADLIISIGARHHLWNIGYNYKQFARSAKKVIVDIDRSELIKKTITPDLAICADAKKFIKEFFRQIRSDKVSDVEAWIETCQNWKHKYPVVLSEYKDEKNYVNSYYFTDVLSSKLPENEIIVTGVGTSFTGTLQCFNIKKGQRLISNVGCAAMGYGLPASIGACIANKKRRIILITGDGSIMMNIQELQTIKHHNLPIKIFLINNNGYLAIKNTQRSFFDGRLEAVDPSSGVSFPNFKKIANSFGINYVSIYNHSEMNDVISAVLNSNGPMLCEIFMNPDQPLCPKVYSVRHEDGSMESRPLEDMYPFLDRKEFLSNILKKEN